MNDIRNIRTCVWLWIRGYVLRVHCDESCTTWYKFNFSAFENKPVDNVISCNNSVGLLLTTRSLLQNYTISPSPGCPPVFGWLNALQLLGHYWQHLHINPIELIKAAPHTRLAETGKELTHHLRKLLQCTIRLCKPGVAPNKVLYIRI